MNFHPLYPVGCVRLKRIDEFKFERDLTWSRVESISIDALVRTYFSPSMNGSTAVPPGSTIPQDMMKT